MRASWRLGLLTGVAVCLSATAQAQGPNPNFLNPVMLLRNSSVRQELKVTDKQEPRVKEEVDNLMKRYTDDREKLRTMSAAEREDFFKKRNEESLKSVANILEAGQVKRLKEIHVQMLGPDAFNQNQVASALKLSDEQKKKIEEIRKEFITKQRDIFTGEGEQREKMEKAVAARRQAQEKAVGVLTAEQQKTWKSMTGEPFDLKPNRTP